MQQLRGLRVAFRLIAEIAQEVKRLLVIGVLLQCLLQKLGGLWADAASAWLRRCSARARSTN